MPIEVLLMNHMLCGRYCATEQCWRHDMMEVVSLNLNDDFVLITPQTQATASLSLQHSFVYVLHLIFKRRSASLKTLGGLASSNKDR